MGRHGRFEMVKLSERVSKSVRKYPMPSVQTKLWPRYYRSIERGLSVRLKSERRCDAGPGHFWAVHFAIP
jgi:hypothetical protein